MCLVLKASTSWRNCNLFVVVFFIIKKYVHSKWLSSKLGRKNIQRIWIFFCNSVDGRFCCTIVYECVQNVRVAVKWHIPAYIQMLHRETWYLFTISHQQLREKDIWMIRVLVHRKICDSLFFAQCLLSGFSSLRF